MPLSDVPFLEALGRGPLVFDGAMGTQLYERGYFITRSFDEANLARPDLVAGIHLARQAAGREAYVAGSIGPTGRITGTLTDERRALLEGVFKEQIEAL